MESGFRFGIGERISAVGIVIGLFGLVAGVSYPLAFPDADPAIIGASILFFVSDLALYLLRRVGIPLGTALAIIGTAFIVIGAIVGLIGALKTDHPSAAQNKESEHPVSNSNAVSVMPPVFTFSNTWQTASFETFSVSVITGS